MPAIHGQAIALAHSMVPVALDFVDVSRDEASGVAAVRVMLAERLLLLVACRRSGNGFRGSF